jgi:hypothetical protein
VKSMIKAGIPPSLTTTCTCCYDETKGTQDQNLFSCSFSDSLSPHPPFLRWTRKTCRCRLGTARRLQREPECRDGFEATGTKRRAIH